MDNSQANSPGHDAGHSPVDNPGTILERHIDRIERELQAVTTERDAMLARVMDRDSLAARVEVLNVLLEAEKRRAEEFREAEARRAEERDRLLDLLREERDRLIGRVEATQAEHVAELMVMREQMARAEHDRNRLTAELAAHIALPWWRRLFA